MYRLRSRGCKGAKKIGLGNSKKSLRLCVFAIKTHKYLSFLTQHSRLDAIMNDVRLQLSPAGFTMLNSLCRK